MAQDFNCNKGRKESLNSSYARGHPVLPWNMSVIPSGERYFYPPVLSAGGNSSRSCDLYVTFLDFAIRGLGRNAEWHTMTGQDPENDGDRKVEARVVETNGGEVMVLAGLMKTGEAFLGLDDRWAR